MVINAILVLAMVFFAYKAITARRLLVSAIWLAGTSALLAVLFFSLGATLIAVIELSVGAGLVTVLFAFAISIAGEEVSDLLSGAPRYAGLALVIAAVALIGLSVLPLATGSPAAPQPETTLPQVIWEQRGLDVLVQIVLIFAGVLGLLGLLAEAKAPLQYPVAEEYARVREKELLELRQQAFSEQPAGEPVEREVV